MEIVGLFIASIFFVLLQGLFAGSEIALVSVDKTKLQAQSKRPGYDFLKAFLERPEEFITLTMLGYSVCIALASTFYTLGVYHLSQNLGFLQGFELLLSATLVVFSVTFGEVLPKSIFRRYCDRLILPSVFVLSGLKKGLSPILSGVIVLSNWIANRLHLREKNSLKLEELLELLKSYSLGNPDLNVAFQVANMHFVSVSQIMTPMHEVPIAEEGLTVKQAQEILKDAKQDLLLVYRGHIDELVGWIRPFEISLEDDNKTIRELAKPITFISEFSSVGYLFEELSNRHESLFIVVEEHGNPLGIVVRDNLYEFLFSFADTSQREPEILQVSKDRWVLGSQTNVDVLERLTGAKLPKGPYSTVGGFFTYSVGRIPQKGQELRIGNFNLKVLKRTERKVLQLILERVV
ncbi:MAG: CNNM domain-containing protein [Aquificaceae bacterium]|nr:CNNM domain-containing protein [Aquificaceae bacterium]